jgi:hypothetical protein
LHILDIAYTVLEPKNPNVEIQSEAEEPAIGQILKRALS